LVDDYEQSFQPPDRAISLIIMAYEKIYRTDRIAKDYGK